VNICRFTWAWAGSDDCDTDDADDTNGDGICSSDGTVNTKSSRLALSSSISNLPLP